MSIVLLLIPLAFVLVAVAAMALFWAVDSGQYDNLDDAGNAPLEVDAADIRADSSVSVITDSGPPSGS